VSVPFDIKELVAAIGASVSVAIAFTAIVGALKAGVLRKVRLGAFEIEASPKDAQVFRKALELRGTEGAKDIPFEIEQLTNYYSQILGQSKVSFWFSLIFASLGFAIIVVAAFLYTDGSGTATVAQFIAGIIMDAIAGLFFVQSHNAQKSMGEFFDKLRNDRLHMESRKLCDTVQDPAAQDALRVHLSLHYSGAANAESIARHITETCLTRSERANPAFEATCAKSRAGAST
jgi:hypothetical protein